MSISRCLSYYSQ